VLPQIISAAVSATGAEFTGSLSRAAALSTGEYAVIHVPAEHPETGVIAVEVHSPTV
jgi:8-oxo-dGTP diphosphatase